MDYAIRDDGGDTLYQYTPGEGNPAPLTVDATNRLWVREATGSGLTFSRVKIDQAAAGRVTLVAGAASKVARLHALVGTMGASGTVKICYDDDGNGTGENDLTGDMDVAALGGLVIPFTRDPDGCLAAPVSKYLTLVTTGGDFNGYAVVSTD